jgi:hypothetical protein
LDSPSSSDLLSDPPVQCLRYTPRSTAQGPCAWRPQRGRDSAETKATTAIADLAYAGFSRGFTDGHWDEFFELVADEADFAWPTAPGAGRYTGRNGREEMAWARRARRGWDQDGTTDGDLMAPATRSARRAAVRAVERRGTDPRGDRRKPPSSALRVGSVDPLARVHGRGSRSVARARVGRRVPPQSLRVRAASVRVRPRAPHAERSAISRSRATRSALASRWQRPPRCRQEGGCDAQAQRGEAQRGGQAWSGDPASSRQVPVDAKAPSSSCAEHSAVAAQRHVAAALNAG